MANLKGNGAGTYMFVTVLLAAFLAAGCASRKIIVKPAGDEISDIQVMLNQLGLKGWRGPLSDMKEKITDQLERVQYGLRNDKMTNVQAAEVISKAQDVINKIDDMAGSSAGKHPHSAGGESQGGYGEDNGESSGNGAGYGNGGYGSGNGGGGGHHHHGGLSGNTDNPDLNDRINDVSDLKEMVDSFYAASTAAAVTPTASDAVTTTASTGTTTTAKTR